MHDTPDAKRRLRRSMKRLIEALPADEREPRSARVRDHLLALPEWTAASIVLLYHAMPDEVATRDMIAAALRSDKRVYLPRLAAGAMGFHRLVDEPRLAPHPYGMLEPDGTTAPWDASELAETLVVCPGRAFDLAGNRLGRGGAFYDRFLRELRGFATGAAAPRLAVGICFDIQVVDAVPVGPGDEPVDALVTDRRVVRV